MLSDRSVCLVKSGSRRAGAAAALCIGAFLLLQGAPAPARADSNFERGFEDQMGRILAYEAVNLGKHILVRGVLHPYPAVYHGGNPSYGGYQPYMSYGGDDHHDRWRGDRHHWRRHDHDRGYWGRGHRKHGHHHHRHDHHDDDCDD
jgi:hypothetical protein